MLSKKIEKALNQHLNEELYSSYLYGAMVAYFEGMNLGGFAQWMRIQVQEELNHAIKFFDYILQSNGALELEAIAKPAKTWDSPLAVFENAYAHECHISKCINKLVDLAVSESDHATQTFLQWFVTEQVEEEATADDVVQKLRLVGTDGAGLFMLDRELAQRQPAAAPADGNA